MTSDALTLSVIASALSPDPRVAPRMARSLGFGGVQFDAFSSSFDVTELSQTGRREFLHVLSGDNQRLVGLRVDLGLKGFGPEADVDRLLSRLGKVMDAAVGLQSRLICVELGPLPEPRSVEKPRPKINPDQAGMLILPPAISAPPPAPAQPVRPADPAFESSVLAAMAELAAKADRYGVTLAFRSDLASFAALQQVIDATGCPWFGIDLDPVALLRDAWTTDEIFSALGGSIRHVRARDAARGADNRTKPLVIGQGDTTWNALLQNLDATGYHGFVTVDPLELTDRTAGAVAGAKYLKGLMGPGQP
jgi:sugar phosphate isomerase/epimerase